MNINDNDIKKTIKKLIWKLQRQSCTTFLNIDKKIKLNQNSDIKDIKKENKIVNQQSQVASLGIRSLSTISIYLFALVKYLIHYISN